MRLYEYEAKGIFSRFSIPLPLEKLITTGQQAGEFAINLGRPVVLKAQILSGGRGRAGGVKFARSSQEAGEQAAGLLSSKVKGYPVEKLLVSEKLDVRAEFYLGITIDRISYKIVIVGCGEGGVEIEETAKRSPERIKKLNLDVDDRLFSFQAQALAKSLGFSGPNLKTVGDIILSLFAVFKQCDAKLVEINPLVLTGENKVVAADARMSIDDDALFRHPELERKGMEKRHEEGEMTPREKKAKEWEIPYLDLDGDIGMFPGGAGFGIMGNDFIHHFGGRPANFMDSGGGPTPERLARMLILLDENPGVKAIFAARFGGISKCDDFAKGVVKFLREHGLSKPMVMRMTGNMWEEGIRIFEQARKENAELFQNIEIHGIETPIEEIAKKAVALTKSVKGK